MPYITIKIANKETPVINADTGTVTPSFAGHMWYSIQETENGINHSYGFGPIEHNTASGLGQPIFDDDANYVLNPSDGDYISETIQITQEQYAVLDRFGQNPFSDEFEFNRKYNGLSNSCIDFVWNALAKAGLIPIDTHGKFFDGDLIPTWNIDNVRSFVNYQLNSQIGIPSVPNFQLTNPLDLGLTNDQFISQIANYYGINEVSAINYNPEYFSNILGFGGGKITAYFGNVSDLLKKVDTTLKDINLSDYINIRQDGNGKEFSIVKNNISIPIKGEETSITDFVNQTIEQATNLASFVGDQLEAIFSPIFNALFSNEETTKDLSNLTSAQRLAGSILADLLLGKDITEIAQNHINQTLISKLIQDTELRFKDRLPAALFEKGVETLDKFITKTVNDAIIRFAIMVAADHRMDSDEYGEAALKALGSAALMKYFEGVGAGNAAVAGFISLYESFKADSSMNSDQYEDAASSAYAAAASAYLGYELGTFLAGIFGAIVPGIGHVVGFAVGYIVGALLYVPLKNNTDSKIDGVKNIYDSIEDIMLRGDISGENLQQMLSGIDDLMISSTGRFVRDFGIQVYNLFGSDYGKKLSPGQYWQPYSSYNVVPKEDGSGNNIIGVDPQGVVLLAAEGKNDDLYGTNGQDILIGRSGKNTIIGYGGNDHIEGRGDEDILVGGSGDDEVFGGNGNDTIYANEGDDTVDGGVGDDIIVGGSGSDDIDGGKGDDKIEGEEGNDYIKGNLGDDIILGGSGNDIIQGNEGDDVILGEDGDDIILGGGESDIIDGGAAVDIIKGEDGNDNLKGGDGDDELSGGLGVDLIYGDSGNDIINAGSGNDLAFGGIGNDIIYGAEGDDSLYGEIGNDYLIGASGNDVLDGFVGDDVVFGGAGNDSLRGGDGNDSFIFLQGDGQDIVDDVDILGSDVIKLVDINSGAIVLTKDGNDLILQFKNSANEITSDKITIKDQFLGGEKIDRIEFADGKKIELANITLSGSSAITYSVVDYGNVDTAIQAEFALGYEDYFRNEQEVINPYSSFYANNYDKIADEEVISERFNDVEWRAVKKARSIFGGHYTVWEKYYDKNINGGNSNDRIVGNWWDENINGGDGDDQTHGNDGIDIIHGGLGQDLIYGGSGDDGLFGEAGNDRIYGQSGNDYIEGGLNNDEIYGGSGDDNILAQVGDDYVGGNEGNDRISLGLGNDVAFGGGGDDQIDGNEENDLIYGEFGDDVIRGGTGDDYISGGSGNDQLSGDDGNDIIYGDLGDDVIHGNSGNDYIFGGKGVDVILGDEGNDFINSESGEDVVDGGAGNDMIKGGEGFDNLKGADGDDIIYGESDGDILDGGNGNDQIFGGTGNDILIDGAGSDILDGGLEKDIIILTKETGSSSSIDVIKGFNKSEDSIILKVSYRTPVTFAIIQEAMLQDGDDVRIDLDNGQKIIIKNINIADINSSNFSIGLSGGSENQVLFGTTANDVLFGDGGNDVIYGGVGNDNLWGGLGYDALYGEEGDDILHYEVDAKYSLTSIRNYYNNQLTDVTGFNRSYDLFDGGTGYDVIIMTEGNDVLQLEDATNPIFPNQQLVKDVAVIFAGSGSDIINFSTLRYSYQNLIVYGGQGNDKIWSGTGNDNILGQEGDDEIYAGLGNDVIDGGADNDSLFGGDGNDLLDGNVGNDILNGGDGDDILIGGKGADTIDGGNGNDTISYNSSLEAINIILQSANIVNPSGGDANGDILRNIENVIGSNYNDNIIGFEASNKIEGKSGDDNLSGGRGNDIYVYNIGDDADTITESGYFSDTIEFGAGITEESLSLSKRGNDLIIKVGDRENDKITIRNQLITGNVNKIEYLKFSNGTIINIGSGVLEVAEDGLVSISKEILDQFLVGDNSTNFLTGAYGNDRIYGNAAYDDLRGGEGSDQIYGGAGADRIYGNGVSNYIIDRADFDWQFYIQNNLDLSGITNADQAWNHFLSNGRFEGRSYNANIELFYEQDANRLYGESDNDYIFGGYGNDYISGGSGNDIVLGNSGDDNIFGDLGEDALYGNSGNDRIDGGSGNDNLYGGDGSDILLGGFGNDNLFGGLNDDDLQGGADNDNLFAEGGNDKLNGGRGDDNLDGGLGNDEMIGASGNDILAGGGGGDTYIYNLGDGNDIIRDQDTNAFTPDKIKFGNSIAKEDVIFVKSGNDLYVLFSNSEGHIKIENHFNGNAVEFAEFSDGSVIDLLNSDSYKAVSQIVLGDDSANRFIGNSYGNNDLFLGNAGNDYIEGGKGSDIIFGGDGDDVIYGRSIGTELVDVKYKAYSDFGINSGLTTFDKYPRLLGDVNGDGKSDIVTFGADGTYVAFGNSSGSFGEKFKASNNFGYNSDTSFNVNPRLLGDINGDGRADIVEFGKSMVQSIGPTTITYFYTNVSLARADGTFNNIVQTNIRYGEGFNASYQSLVDMNGDGRLDPINFGQALAGNSPTWSSAIYSGLSNANGTISTTLPLDSNYYVVRLSDVNGAPIVASTFINTANIMPRSFADINGDGKADLVAFFSDGVYAFLGNSLTSGSYEGFLSLGFKTKIINDYGSNFGYTTQDRNPRYLADINGDGKVDIIAFADDGVYVSLGNGNATFQNKIKITDDFSYNSGWTSNDKNPRFVADINGDGKVEIVGFANDGVYISSSLTLNNDSTNAIYGGSGNDTIYGEDSADIIYGNDGSDTIYGGLSNDLLFDGAGSDFIDGGGNSDIITITKESLSTDTIDNFNASEDKIILKLHPQELILFDALKGMMQQNGANAEISFVDGYKIIIKNFNKANINSTNFSIENAKNLSLVTYDGDSEINIASDVPDVVVSGSRITVSAQNGAASLNGNGDFSYKPNSSFFGVDTVIYQVRDSSGNGLYSKTYNIFVTANNNAPIGDIPNFEVKLDEQFSINLSDYFSDIDGDNLSYFLKINGSETLPDYITFDQVAKTISGSIGVVQSLNLEVTANDNSGGITTDSFLINSVAETIAATALSQNLSSLATASNYLVKNGSNFSDRLIAENQSSYIKGNAGDDIIIGSQFDDILEGGAGSDAFFFNRDSGNDIITDFNAAQDVIHFSDKMLNSGIMLSTYDGANTRITFAGIEDVSLTLQNFNISNQQNHIIFDNNTPVAQAIAASISEDNNNFTLSFRATDIDIGDNLTYVILSNPTQGNVVNNNNGTFTFNLNNDFNNLALNQGRNVNFTYKAIDANGAISNIATVIIAVVGTNDAPIATMVNATLDEDNYKIIDVLSQAIDVDNGDILSISAITNPVHGRAEIIDGKIKYTPNANYGGSDNFNYTISDNYGGLVTKELILTINSVNDAPNATLVNAATNEDIAITIDVLASASDVEGDILSISNITNPLHGVAQIINGKINYTPNLNYNGSDNFNYTISDGYDGLITKTLNLNIVAVNDAPTATLTSITTNEDNILTIDVLAKASDVDGDILSISNITNPLDGVAQIVNGKINYTPNQNYNGSDNFNYTISDGHGGFITKTINITINSINDTPTINAIIPTQQATIGKSFSYQLDRSLFSDVDGDNLKVSIKQADGSGLPSWLTFDFASLELRGIPPQDSYGLKHLSLIIADASAQVFSNFNLVIENTLAPIEGVHITSSAGNNTADFVLGTNANDDMNYDADGTWEDSGYYVQNSYTLDMVSISGKGRIFDAFDGRDGYDTLNLTDGDDVVALDDPFSANPSSTVRFHGIEVINGNGGNDVMDFSSTTLTYGNLTMNGGNGQDVLWGNDGDDVINGFAGNDNINGGRGNDILNGCNGNDIIKGYDGEDRIYGGSGADELTGGLGKDIFIYNNISDSTSINYDSILDFIHNEDKIDLTKLNLHFNNLDITHDINHNFTMIQDHNSNFEISLNGQISLDQGDFV